MSNLEINIFRTKIVVIVTGRWSWKLPVVTKNSSFHRQRDADREISRNRGIDLFPKVVPVKNSRFKPRDWHIIL